MIATLTLWMVIGFHHHNDAPGKPIAQICSVRVVGFKFIGVEGQKFELGSVTYTVDKRGYVELISDGETTYRYGDKTLPLTVWPANEFGMLEVPLPKP